MKRFLKFLRLGLMVWFFSMTIMPSLAFAGIFDADGNKTSVIDVKPVSQFTTGTGPAQTVSDSGSGSGTSSSDIFTILQKKLYNTLVDLRQIVYVISGFGLVMFAVAAIFNKISYKHLGYIMIGLSLLSLMFPFLEYFSGYTLEDAAQKQLTFDNYLAASDYSRIRGELEGDVLNGNGEGQTALSEEEIARKRKEMEENMLQPIDSSGLTGSVTGGNTGGLAGERPGVTPGTVKKGEWDPETGTRTVVTYDQEGKPYVTTETCQGTLKNGTCQKTAGQTLQDIWRTGQDVVQAGLGAAYAWQGIQQAFSDTGSGFEGLGAIMNSDLGFFDKIYYAGNLASNTWGSTGAVTNDLTSIIGGLMKATGSAGNIGTTWSTDPENNASGQNPFSALMSLLGGYGQNAQNSVVGAAGNVNNVADYGSDLHTQANNINVILSIFGLR